MSLIGLILVLCLIGLLLYIVNMLPLDATIKKVIHIVALIVVVLWLLQVFGVLGPLGEVRVR
jgi:hypothetical protein